MYYRIVFFFESPVSPLSPVLVTQKLQLLQISRGNFTESESPEAIRHLKSPPIHSTVTPLTTSIFLQSQCRLISNGSNVTVTSDVRGNLGPPSVVLNEDVEDWLSDR